MERVIPWAACIIQRKHPLYREYGELEAFDCKIQRLLFLDRVNIPTCRVCSPWSTSSMPPILVSLTSNRRT